MKWKLFYDDEDNYYLISSDYVPVDTLSGELYRVSEGLGSAGYIACFATSIIDYPYYNGIIMESEPWSNGSLATTIQENPLTSKYLRWVGSSENTEKTNLNMRAVAYMMDTSKWSNFAGNESGSKAIGGPTLEMFVKSWNAKHDKKLSTYEDESGNSTINHSNATSNGYKAKWENDNTSMWDDWPEYITGLDTSTDDMWVKPSNEKAYGMWLSSPGHRYAYAVGCVGYQEGEGGYVDQRKR